MPILLGCVTSSENVQNFEEPSLNVQNTAINPFDLPPEKTFLNYCFLILDVNASIHEIKDLVPYSEEWRKYEREFPLSDSELYYDKCITKLAVLKADPFVCGQSWVFGSQWEPLCEDYATGKEILPQWKNGNCEGLTSSIDKQNCYLNSAFAIGDSEQCIKWQKLTLELNDKSLTELTTTQCLLESSIKDIHACELLKENLQNYSDESVIWAEIGYKKESMRDTFTALEFSKKETLDLCYSLNKKELNSCKKFLDAGRVSNYVRGLYSKCIYQMALVKWGELE